MSAEKIVLDYSTPNTLCIRLNGVWLITSGIPEVNETAGQLNQFKNIQQLIFDTSGLQEWDSGLVAFLFHLIKECDRLRIQVNLGGLPAGVQKLLALVSKVHSATSINILADESFFTRVGERVLRLQAG
ncbi:MAG TPA: STAS domain-containing protein, partial [Candidatus Omnitrophota bacterium]|nr:STAS domain-containing protein [Candidatus Omnitrophota bacterium]